MPAAANHKPPSSFSTKSKEVPAVSRLSFLKSAYLTLLSQPSHERLVYRLIRTHRPGTIVELGVGRAVRSQRMLQLAAHYSPGEKIRFTGIDMFEGRDDPSSSLSLKEAHRLLKASGGRVHLVPGDPLSALSRSANSLQGTDLLVIGADQDERSLEQAWFYIPRMLHDQSIVVIEDRTGSRLGMRVIPVETIDQFAARNASSRRAA